MELETIVDTFDTLKDDEKKIVFTDLKNTVLANLKIKNYYLTAFEINTKSGQLETIFQNTNNKDCISIDIWSEFDCFYDDMYNQTIYCFELSIHKDGELVSNGTLTYTNNFKESLKWLENYIKCNLLEE